MDFTLIVLVRRAAAVRRPPVSVLPSVRPSKPAASQDKIPFPLLQRGSAAGEEATGSAKEIFMGFPRSENYLRRMALKHTLAEHFSRQFSEPGENSFGGLGTDGLQWCIVCVVKKRVMAREE